MPLIPGDWSKEISKFKVSLGQSKSQIQVWWYIPLIWATPSTGGLHKDMRRRKIQSSSCACTYLPGHLLEPTSIEDQLKQLASWNWATTIFLDFPFTANHVWLVELQTVNYDSKFPQVNKETLHKFCNSRELTNTELGTRSGVFMW